MKRILTYILLLLLPLALSAQKKEISSAADQVKSGKNLSQAEQSMLKLLKDSANRDNPKIYRLLNASIQKQYEQMNEKMYLKQSLDTASMFQILHKAFVYAFMTDSVDESFRKRNGEFLSKYIANLYSGGLYFLGKKKYKEAYDLFDMYISSKDTPLLVKGRQNVKRMKAAAYSALTCGYLLGDYEKTVKHKNQALLFESGKIKALKYLAETYQQKDSTYRMYVESLETGFEEFPCEEYFYTQLIDYHLSNQRLQEALDIAERALNQCEEKARLSYIKSNILLYMEDYSRCIAAADSTIALTNEIDDIYYIAGIANLYHANELTKEAETAGKKYDTKVLLETARTHFEEYRKRCPDRKDRWGTPLYHIYLNLNKGKEFEEISKTLKQ